MMRRHPHDPTGIRHIPHHHAAGAYHAVFSDSDPLDDTRAGANKRPSFQMNATGKRSAGGNVGMRFKNAIVVHGCPGIYDCIGAYATAGLNNGAGHDLDSLFQACRRRNGRCRMQDRGKNKSA